VSEHHSRWRLQHAYAALRKQDASEGRTEIDGYVATPLGIVGVSAGQYPKRDGSGTGCYASLRFVWGGSAHQFYTEDVPTFTERALTARAHRFAKQVVDEADG
jgi:hypothetical protein